MRPMAISPMKYDNHEGIVLMVEDAILLSVSDSCELTIPTTDQTIYWEGLHILWSTPHVII